MATVYLKKGILLLKVVAYTLGFVVSATKRSINTRPLNGSQITPSKNNKAGEEHIVRQIVIIGASFAGYHAARLVAESLPTDGSWKIVIIEPNTHYQFTWTLPRFCVVEGHEDKTFIPYGHYIPERARPLVRWVHQRASAVTHDHVILHESGEEIPYEFLVIATGSGVGLQLPSRVGATQKSTGTELLRAMQTRIKEAGRIIVIGGGAAGVELASDAKSLYPEKHVTLVHSRSAVMHRFGPELQATATRGLKELGVEVILEERAALGDGKVTGIEEGHEPGTLALTSGKQLEYDLCVSHASVYPCV